MKSSHFLQNKFVIPGILIILTLISLFLHLKAPNVPYMNADEAAFGYNAYSIAKTGREEYGILLPMRLPSFSDNKLPLLTYLIIPFVSVLGLNEFAIRMPTLILGVLSPLLFYIVTLQITKKKEIALVAAAFASVSPWIHTISRQTHETILASTLLMLTLYFFFKFTEKLQIKHLAFSSIFLMLSLFAYHTSKVFVIFFIGWLFVTLKNHRVPFKKISKMLLIFFIPLAIFIATEITQPAVRVANLLFFKDPGFEMSILQSIREHDTRLVHNKLTHAIITLTNRYISYFSPDFLVINGDNNPRFGMKGLSPITVIEYILLLIGIYFLFKKKESYRYPLIFLLLIAPFAASLAWLDNSLTRSFCMIVPIIFIVSYGTVNLYQELENKWLRIGTFAIGIGAFLFYTFFSYEFYFHHYAQHPLVTRNFQAGYKELAELVQKNYDKYDTIYITRQHGQPYIFMLFYLKYPPEKYQPQAKISAADEYGFGQVEKFDKFVFDFKSPVKTKKSLVVGYPADFTALPEEEQINLSEVKKIKIGTEEMFWYYETK